MKFIVLILSFAFGVSLYGQVKLPDIGKIDSVRIVHRKTGDGPKIQYVSIESGDTVRSALQDSAALASLLVETIAAENAKAANNTFLLYQQFTKAKGTQEYNKMFRRVAGVSYPDYVWSSAKTPYLGGWNLSGQGITAHVFTVTEDARATRSQGVPRYAGKFQVLAPGTRVQLVNYLKPDETITFDFVGRNTVTQGGQQLVQDVFMSTDGLYFLYR